MKQISSVDLAYLVKEFKFLEDQRVDNFYFENESFYIKFYVRGGGTKYLVNKVSKYIFIDDSKEDSSEPSNFIQYLRKYLKNAFLREISQVGTERILKLTLEKKEGERIVNYNLYLELFANGNVVLCDDSNIIKNALLKKKYKDRDLLVNREYVLPPPREFSLINLDVSKFMKTLDKDNLAKSLAMGLGIGGKFATELATSPNVEDELSLMLDRKLEPCLLVDNDKYIDFYPFKFNSVKGELKVVESFNLAVKMYYSQFNEEVDQREVEFEKQLAKLKNRLEKVNEQKESILLDYEEYNSVGNRIYEKYSEVEEMLKEINLLSKSKGWEFIAENKDAIGSKYSIKIDKLNYKNNEIIVEF